MQWYGNSMREKFGSDFWLKKVRKQIKECNTDMVVITDVRFVEECTMVNDFGANIVYMDRDQVLGPMTTDSDISEKVVYESRDWARANAEHYYEIDNNGIMISLYENLEKVFEYLNKTITN